MGLKKISASAKLYSLTTMQVGTMLLIALLGYKGSSILYSYMEELAFTQVPAMRNLMNADMMHEGINGTVWNALAVSNRKDEKEYSAVKEQLDHQSKEMRESFLELSKLNVKPVIKQDAIKIGPTVENYIEAANQTVKLAFAGDEIGAKSQMENFNIKFKELEVGLEDLSLLIENESKKIPLEAKEAFNKSSQANLIVTSISVILAMLVSILTVRFLVKELSILVAQVDENGIVVKNNSEQLFDSARQLSGISQEQASSIQETSSSLTELVQMVETNVEQSNQSAKSAREVLQICNDTRSSMEVLELAMSQIKESNVKIEQLVKVIEEIAEKTEVIDDIVFKTQLLSFNASVEAERAGDQGRGFAVVAQEVGNLAKMSGDAATDIAKIVKKSVVDASAIVHENTDKVVKGSELTGKTKEKLASVMSYIENIVDSVSRIAEASKEQSLGLNQISLAVESLNQTTQETSKSSEMSEYSAQELKSQAERLNEIVHDLRTIIMGGLMSHHQSITSKVNSPQTLMSKVVENVLPLNRSNSTKEKIVAANNAKSKTIFEKKVAGGSNVASDDPWDKI